MGVAITKCMRRQARVLYRAHALAGKDVELLYTIGYKIEVYMRG